MRGGEVRQIKELLLRYSALKAPEGIVVDAFVRAVKEVCGIELQKTALRYAVSSKTIGLSFAGPRKTEIMLQRGKILEVCKKDLGEKSAPRTIV